MYWIDFPRCNTCKTNFCNTLNKHLFASHVYPLFSLFLALCRVLWRLPATCRLIESCESRQHSADKEQTSLWEIQDMSNLCPLLSFFFLCDLLFVAYYRIVLCLLKCVLKDIFFVADDGNVRNRGATLLHKGSIWKHKHKKKRRGRRRKKERERLIPFIITAQNRKVEIVSALSGTRVKYFPFMTVDLSEIDIIKIREEICHFESCLKLFWLGVYLWQRELW